MPTDGAKPQLLFLWTSRPGYPASCHRPLNRNATDRDTRRLRSTVARPWLALPPVIRRLWRLVRCGALVTRLIDPPVAPRPPVTEEGPLATITDSVLNM